VKAPKTKFLMSHNLIGGHRSPLEKKNYIVPKQVTNLQFAEQERQGPSPPSMFKAVK